MAATIKLEIVTPEAKVFSDDVEMVTLTSRDPGPPPYDYITRSGGIFRDMTIHDFDVALMDLHMPGWKAHRDELNREPVRPEVRRVEQGELGL